ncbi:MAG: hypothetical protein G01um101429_146 [Parcubacteria group bacterium Gr01-1014_29]|nr:MAG: hypothetical protein G01um101429_146 [Parcubacteria group bacterium Gr01-1014_29]
MLCYTRLGVFFLFHYLYNTYVLFIFIFVSGFFAYLAYPPAKLSVAAFFFLIPLFLFLRCKLGKRETFLGGFAAGTFFSGFALRWLFFMIPVDWLGLPESMTVVWLMFFWGSIVCIIGCFWGLFAIFAQKHIQNIHWHSFIIIPSLWVLAEYLWTLTITLFWNGGGSILGVHWQYGAVADMLAAIPIILPITRLGGPFFGSFFVVFINLTLFLALCTIPSISPNTSKKTVRLLAIALIAIITLLISAYAPFVFQKESSTPLRVALVQTSIPPSPFGKTLMDSTTWEHYHTAIRNAAADKPDVIVLPETRGFFHKEPLVAPSIASSLGALAEHSLLIIDSGFASVNGAARLQTFYVDAREGPVAVYYKNLLVPIGEHLPTIIKLVAAIFPESTAPLNMLDTATGREPAKPAPHSVSWNGVSFGTLACSGIFSSILYRNLVREGANILINSASHAVFRQNKQLSAQIEAKGAVQAASLMRPFLQTANGGALFVIAKDGRKIVYKEPISSGSFSYTSIEISPSYISTPFKWFGNWIVWASALIYGGYLLSTQKQLMRTRES